MNEELNKALEQISDDHLNEAVAYQRKGFPWVRSIAAVLALVMVLLLMPVVTLCAAASTVTYTLDTTADLTAFDAGAKKDGDSEVVKDFFTIFYILFKLFYLFISNMSIY